MGQEKTYVIVRCPICGLYTLALLGQKTRLCVRCGNRSKVDSFHSERVRGFKKAQRLVKELNSEAGKEVIGSGLPNQLGVATAEETQNGNGAGKNRRKGMLRTFQEEVLKKFANREVEISELLEECKRLDIPKEFAEKIIKKLIDSGQAYKPRKESLKLLL